MKTLHSRLSLVPPTSRYFTKDLAKAARANKFIGKGSPNSSTNKYMVAAGNLANCGSYLPEDNVFVSVEGARPGRTQMHVSEINLAIEAGSTIIADDLYARSRPYNCGERELAAHLTGSGYREQSNGTWSKLCPANTTSNDCQSKNASIQIKKTWKRF